MAFEGNKIKVQQDYAFMANPYENDPTLWSARLDVRFSPQEEMSAPYQGDFAVGGDFRIIADFPDEEVEEMVRLNAGAILYGAIREMVMTLSARSVHGKFVLPAIDTRIFLKKEEVVE